MSLLRQLILRLRVVMEKRRAHQAKLRLLRHQQNLNKKLIKLVSARKLPHWKQLRHVGRVLSPLESNLVRLSIVAIVGAAAFLLYANFLHSTVTVPALGGTYTEGEVGYPASLNPLLAPLNGADQDLTRLMYNGLVRYDKNYTIVPDLAKSWTVSADNKVLTFTLRDDVEWHDGSDVSVDDVVATFSAIQTPDLKSPLLRTFSGVKIEKTDDSTVTFTLPVSLPGFLKNLTVGIMPAKAATDLVSDPLMFAKGSRIPVGTGPYKFVSMEKDKSGKISSIKLAANTRYHLSAPNIGSLVFDYFPDYQTEVDQLKNKMIDGLGYIPKEYLSEVNKHDINLTTLELTQFTAIFFNQETDTLLKKPVIREALSLATNKQLLVEDVLHNQGYPLHGPILPGFPGYDKTIIDAYDPSQAQKILKDDGWEMNKEGVLEKKKTPFEIKLTIIDLPDMQILGKLLKDQWQQIGVKTILEPVDPANLTKDVLQERNYEALAVGEIISPDGDLFPYWHSSQKTYPGLNLAQYINRSIDDLLEKVRGTSMDQDKAGLMRQIQTTIRNDNPALFLYAQTYSYPINSTVKTVPMSRLSLPSDRFWNITDWYIITKKAWK